MADSATLTQTLPASGVWDIDRAHSTVEFVARHLMVTKVRGTFDAFEGSITVGDKPETSVVTATITTATINTHDSNRDGHLRSKDFFDAETYPTIAFTSTRIEAKSKGEYIVHGDLNLHGVTRPIALAVEYQGVVTDPFGRDKALFSATTEIDREEWGLTWNQPLQNGGFLVSKKITIEIEAQAIRRTS